MPADIPEPSVKLPGILFIAYYYPPENAIGGVRPARMAKYLARLGHPVTVIARDPDAPNDTGVRVIPQVRLKPPAIGQRTATRGFRLLQRLIPQNERLNWLAPAVSAASSVLETVRAEVIVSTSPPLVTHLAAMALQRKFNLKWVADFRDPLFGNTLRLDAFTYRCDRLLERRIFDRAGVLIANTPDVAKEWSNRYPDHRAKLTTIPNGYDPEEQFEPITPEGRQCRVISHVGHIYAGRDPSPVLASVDRLVRRGDFQASEIQIRLVGKTEDNAIHRSDLLRSLAAAGALHFPGQPVPKDEAIRETLSADCLLLLDSTSGAQVPGKLFEYISIGRPILAITRRDSAMDRILRDSGIPCSYIYPDTPPEQIDRDLISILRAPVSRTTPSDSYLRQFDGANQARQLSEIIVRL